MDSRTIQYSLIAAVAYVVLSSPQVYKFTNNVSGMFGLSTSNPAGCPNMTGLVIHGSVVGLIVYALLSQVYLIAPVSSPLM